jgi:hypothetical protein
MNYRRATARHLREKTSYRRGKDRHLREKTS